MDVTFKTNPGLLLSDLDDGDTFRLQHVNVREEANRIYMPLNPESVKGLNDIITKELRLVVSIDNGKVHLLSRTIQVHRVKGTFEAVR
jgi:hypothetical protein